MDWGGQILDSVAPRFNGNAYDATYLSTNDLERRSTAA